MSDQMERWFAKMFWETEHWWAQRAAASGSGGEADLPDVTFAAFGTAFAGEEKTTSETYVYVPEEEIADLRAYAEAYGMTPVVIGRFKRTSPSLVGTSINPRAFYIWHPDDMDRTDAGTYRGHPQDGNWAAKVKEPGGDAIGVLPGDLSPFHLYHACMGKLGKGITERSETGWRP